MKDDEKGLVYNAAYGFGVGVKLTIIAIITGFLCGTLAGMAVVTYNAFVNMFI